MSARDELYKCVYDAFDALDDPNETRNTAAIITDELLAAGYSKPRTITTADELDALPQKTLIRAVLTRNPTFGDVFERFLSGWLHLDPSDREDGESTTSSAAVLRWHGDKSVTVLYTPKES